MKFTMFVAAGSVVSGTDSSGRAAGYHIISNSLEIMRQREKQKSLNGKITKVL